MPKNKTHSGTKKRIKVSGSGKLLREKAGKRHLLEKKSSEHTRRLAGQTEIAPQDDKRVRRMLGI
ncbi:50S ribosomal protein L35 [Actinomycetospora aeridis]|jgi:large subunit ribosomal protein L35|uniref:Large ribosomal subunit protein bL35 n=1 Tax=Actinomycetospora aeridis TaxID=3129231 RepID=A0ABU8NFI2_9PSEU